MSDEKRSLYSGGIPDPQRFGIAFYRSSGKSPDAQRIAAVAVLLGRPERYLDDDGYECEIIAAAFVEDASLWAYVESRAKQVGQGVDINFHLHIGDRLGHADVWQIESYNPYFGCDVRLLEWFGDTVLIIYREKHDTYICRFGINFPAEYYIIEDDWVLKDSQLAYWGYGDEVVSRRAVPSLEELPPLSEAQAADQELVPEKYW